MAKSTPPFAVRGPILHCVGDPFVARDDDAIEFYDDGMLVIQDGKVLDLGGAESLREKHVGVDIRHCYGSESLIIPGFVDAHVHFAQTNVIGAGGEQLLRWLENHVYPEERKFANKAYAAQIAEFFIEQLLRNGTTTAAVFGTVYPASIEALFEAAERSKMCIISGKVMMDRNAPAYLLDTATSSYEESQRLIEKWHNKPGTRLHYAITPRFAGSCSPEQLALAKRLRTEHPSVLVQTHMSENVDEIRWVAELFPDFDGYLDVYDQHGLLGPRTILAHCIHTRDDELSRISATGTAIAFCPTSNMFLGSGLFDLRRAKVQGVNVAMGTDIGAGTSFSMFATLLEAYKVGQLQRQTLSPAQAFYLATLGGAKSLSLDAEIGNFESGKEADFVVIDLQATPLLAQRMQYTTTLAERLFVLMTLADDRAVTATYLMGELAHAK